MPDFGVGLTLPAIDDCSNHNAQATNTDDDDAHNACSELRRISLDGLQRHSILSKLKWVVKRSYELPALISKTTQRIRDLEDLFPLSQSKRLELAQQQTVWLIGKAGYDMLVEHQRAVKDQIRDEAWLEAIRKLESAGTTTTSVSPVTATFGANNSGLQGGVISGGNFNIGSGI